MADGSSLLAIGFLKCGENESLTFKNLAQIKQIEQIYITGLTSITQIPHLVSQNPETRTPKTRIFFVISRLK
ncbi:MAG TPA: hypothetical protein DEO71_18205 [Chryseobacterium sp.]|nr:hypothetical protein [Chryseobacterium sp.]